MLQILALDEVRHVEKPWGYEKWIADGAPNFRYALKHIFIRAPYKSSLQFHEAKEETNVIVSGRGKLHFSNQPIDVQKYQDGGYSQAELDALLATMEVQDLTPGMVFHVKPGYLHRVESVEDLLMVESSTVELDDVFRIHDDTNRPDGYIASEHNSN